MSLDLDAPIEVRAVGALQANERDEPVHSYHFEVTRDGVTMLNGTDLGPIIAQMQ